MEYESGVDALRGSVPAAIAGQDVEAADDVHLCVVVGRSGRIEDSSAAAQLLLNLEPARLIGLNAWSLIHPRDRACLGALFRGLKPGVRVGLPHLRVRQESGEWKTLTGHATALLPAAGPSALLVELCETVAEQRLRAVGQISRALSGAYTVAAVVDAVLQTGLDVVKADAGSISVLSESGDGQEQTLELVGHRGYAPQFTASWTRFSLTLDTPITQAVRLQKALFLDDTDFRKQFPQIHGQHSARFQSAAVLPLLVGTRVLGVLSLSFRHNRTLATDEREFLQTIADLCAPALDRASLHAALGRQQAWHQAVTTHSSDIATVLDSKCLIRYQSGSIERVLAYSPTELTGRNVFELIHPDDHAPVRAALQRLNGSAEPVSATFRFRHHSGHWVWLESIGADFQEDAQVQGFLINSRDVTAREEARLAHQASLEELAASERSLRRLADNAGDLIRQYSRDGEIEYVSPSAFDLLGYTSQELMGMDAMHLIHPGDLPLMQDVFKRRFEYRSDLKKLEYRIRRRDGEYRWVEMNFKAVRDAQGQDITAFISTARDIEQRKQAELQLLDQVNRYRQLLDFTVSLEQRDSPVALTREALQKCLELTEYDYGYAFEYAEDRLTPGIHAGHVTPQTTSRIETLWTQPFAAAIWQAMGQHRAYFVAENEAAHDPPEETPRAHLRSFCVLPITQRGELTSLLVFGTDQVVSASSETRRLLGHVAARLSHALERHDHLDQLNTSREETLRALGLALEYRDYETKGHTDRVVAFAERLGRMFGFAGEQLDALRWGAFLHDTGKVAIPDAILLKPGKLLPCEWEVIQRHPIIGFEMLQHIPSLPQLTLDVVLYHQERWNGSGYPLGLVADAIPLAARLFAVVDVYDALTSARPYKHAWTHQAAADQLRKEAGVLLDARVVEAFLGQLGTQGVPEAEELSALEDGQDGNLQG